MWLECLAIGAVIDSAHTFVTPRFCVRRYTQHILGAIIKVDLDRAPNMGLGFAVGVLAVLILFHAAYSTIQYRGLLKITEEEFSGPPFDVVIELTIGLVLSMWAALTVPGKFLSIHPDSEENRIVSLPANLDFMIFNHRGKVFPVEMDLKLKQ